MLQLPPWVLPEPREQSVHSLLGKLSNMPFSDRMHDLRNRIHEDPRRADDLQRVPMCGLQLPMRDMSQHSKLLHELRLRLPILRMEMRPILLLRFPGHLARQHDHLQPELLQLPDCPVKCCGRFIHERDHNHFDRTRFSGRPGRRRSNRRLGQQAGQPAIQQSRCHVEHQQPNRRHADRVVVSHGCGRYG